MSNAIIFGVPCSAALDQYSKLNSETHRLKCCYWVDDREFQEVTIHHQSPFETFTEIHLDCCAQVKDFVLECEGRYGLEMHVFDGKVSFKQGIEILIAGGVRAVVMGTRSSDPDGRALETFQPSSAEYRPTRSNSRSFQFFHSPAQSSFA